MTREIIAGVCGAAGLALAGICVYALGGWIYLGILLSGIMLVGAGILANRPDDQL